MCWGIKMENKEAFEMTSEHLKSLMYFLVQSGKTSVSHNARRFNEVKGEL